MFTSSLEGQGSLTRKPRIRDGLWGQEHAFLRNSSHFLGHVSYTVTEDTASKACVLKISLYPVSLFRYSQIFAVPQKRISGQGSIETDFEFIKGSFYFVCFLLETGSAYSTLALNF